MSRKQPRPHQLLGIQKLRDGFRAFHKRQLLVCPTGAGKTILALEMIRLACERGRRALFLCDRRTLVNQAAKEARDYWLETGIVMAGVMGDRDAPCQFASKDTILSREYLPPADLVIVDEAHRSLGEAYKGLLDNYPDAFVVGLTATPAREDGKGFGDYFTNMVVPIQPSELIAQGLLVPSKCYVPEQVDHEGKRKRLPASDMVGNAVRWWRQYGDGRVTFVYATRVDHSMALEKEYQDAGISAAHVDAHTPDDRREEIYGRMNDGKLMVVCSVGVAREGVDVPRASCIQLCCSLGSYVAYRQSCGRGQRPFPGKADCAVIDHAGNVLEHGFPDADVEWTLSTSDEETMEKRAKRQMEEGKIARPVVCPKCFCGFSGRPDCPSCGYKLSAQARARMNKSGLLVELEQDFTPSEMQSFKQKDWVRFVGMAYNAGWTCGRASSMFKSKYKVWPDAAGVKPELPYDCAQRLVRDVFPNFGRKEMAS